MSTSESAAGSACGYWWSVHSWDQEKYQMFKCGGFDGGWWRWELHGAGSLGGRAGADVWLHRVTQQRQCCSQGHKDTSVSSGHVWDNGNGVDNGVLVGLGPNSISNFARKLSLVVYLMDSSVSVEYLWIYATYLMDYKRNKYIYYTIATMLTSSVSVDTEERGYMQVCLTRI